VAQRNAKTQRNATLINLWIELERKMDKLTIRQIACVFGICASNVRRLILEEKQREFRASGRHLRTR